MIELCLTQFSVFKVKLILNLNRPWLCVYLIGVSAVFIILHLHEKYNFLLIINIIYLVVTMYHSL